MQAVTCTISLWSFQRRGDQVDRNRSAIFIQINTNCQLPLNNKVRRTLGKWQKLWVLSSPLREQLSLSPLIHQRQKASRHYAFSAVWWNNGMNKNKYSATHPRYYKSGVDRWFTKKKNLGHFMNADPCISSDPHLHLLLFTALETTVRNALCRKTTRDVYYQTDDYTADLITAWTLHLLLYDARGFFAVGFIHRGWKPRQTLKKIIIVSVRKHILFLSSKGIRLLSRQLQTFSSPYKRVYGSPIGSIFYGILRETSKVSEQFES